MVLDDIKAQLLNGGAVRIDIQHFEAMVAYIAGYQHYGGSKEQLKAWAKDNGAHAYFDPETGTFFLRSKFAPAKNSQTES